MHFKQQEKPKICPKCKSENLKFKNNSLKINTGNVITDKYYICNDCGNRFNSKDGEKIN